MIFGVDFQQACKATTTGHKVKRANGANVYTFLSPAHAMVLQTIRDKFGNATESKPVATLISTNDQQENDWMMYQK